MTPQATVRKVANGYVITSSGSAVPTTLFAATIPEVVYWLGKIFTPYA